MDRAGSTTLCSVSFDKDVLLQLDTYIKTLRDNGTMTNRSALVNTAILCYLAEMSAKDNKNE